MASLSADRFFHPQWDNRMPSALTAELVGSLLLQFAAGLATSQSYEATPLGTALGVATAYVVLVFLTKRSSGGHLNPAVSFAAALTGHFHWAKAISYIIVQITGATLGCLLQAALVPGLHLGKHEGPGCISSGDLGNGALFGWETVGTFILTGIYYATVFGRTREFESVGPIAIGAAQLLMSLIGGGYSGALINPIRMLAPAMIFFCTGPRIWTYLAGQFLGAALAAAFGTFLYSAGGEYSTNNTSSAAGGSVGPAHAHTTAGAMVRDGIDSAREALLGSTGLEPPRPADAV